MTLVIMAAGMGSRFGGLKQIEPVDDNNNFIIDYSIYDAIKAGFNKIVFIIKEENYDVFRETVGKRIEGKIDVKYVFQKQDDIPVDIEIPESRKSPWGTGHAIYACRDVVDEGFAVINADDFYGRDAFVKMYDFLKNNQDESLYSMIGYMTKNTLTENGAVKRGVCKVEDGYLTGLIESNVEEIDGKMIAKPLNGSEQFTVSDNQPVSMNFWGFSKGLFDILNKDIVEFFSNNLNNLEKCEFLIPDVIFNQVKLGNLKVKVINTDSIWHGVTYKEDKDELVRSLKELVNNGVYPTNLWD